MSQIYLILSSDARWMTKQREDLIAELIPREMRDENLHDFYSGTNQQLKLADILPEVLGELSTLPFLPDSRRVVVVHDLSDFFAGGRKSRTARAGKGKAAAKKPAPMTAVDALALFARRDLPATGNVLIFSTLIEYDRGQYLDDKGALMTFLRECPLARIVRPPHREEDPLFLMGNALLERNAIVCLRHFRTIYRDDMRQRVFSEILKNVRFLLQAKVLGKIADSGKKPDTDLLLPPDKRFNFAQQPEWAQQKFRRAIDRFQLSELLQALSRLLDINRHLYPSRNAVYVPDAQFLFETFILQFCESGSRNRRA